MEEMIFIPKLIVNPNFAKWLRDEGAWNDDHMLESKRLPECPEFLKEPSCIACTYSGIDEQMYCAYGCPNCTCGVKHETAGRDFQKIFK